MRKLTAVKLGLIALLAIGAGCSREASVKEISFNKDIFPIFQERCMTCHALGAPGCLVSGFSLATYDTVMKGTTFGPMVIPGSSAESNLLRLVKHQADPSIAMPRSQTPGQPSEWLKPEQINLIETWINQGAKNN
jgi:Planctomycete cytochrome C